MPKDDWDDLDLRREDTRAAPAAPTRVLRPPAHPVIEFLSRRSTLLVAGAAAVGLFALIYLDMSTRFLGVFVGQTGFVLGLVGLALGLYTSFWGLYLLAYRQRTVAGPVLLGMLSIIVAMATPTIEVWVSGRLQSADEYARCSSNLRLLAQAVFQYTERNATYPPRDREAFMEALWDTLPVGNRGMFFCPSRQVKLPPIATLSAADSDYQGGTFLLDLTRAEAQLDPLGEGAPILWERHPNHPENRMMAYFRKTGVRLLEPRVFQEKVERYVREVEAPIRFGRARRAARAMDDEEALYWLEQAALVRFSDTKALDGAVELDSLRDTPEFKRLEEKIKGNVGKKWVLQ